MKKLVSHTKGLCVLEGHISKGVGYFFGKILLESEWLSYLEL